VNRLRNQGSEAVSIAVEEAKVYVQSQRIVGADETGFKQGNADGKNAEKKKAWLWVAVTPLVTLNKSDVGSFDRSGPIFIGRKV